jgi:iron complex outermembrane recepter protein
MLMKTHNLAFDPAQKGWMENIANYVAPMAIGNDDRCETEDRDDLTAQLGYTFPLGGDGQEVKFSVFGRNLTNNKGLAATLPVAGLFTFSGARPPRQFGAEVGFKF